MNYLIHFETRYQHAQHYIGFVERDLPGRIKYHAAGRGSRLVGAVARAGIRFIVARIWPDADRNHERRLKRSRHAHRYCPICRGEATFEELIGVYCPITEA